MSASPTSRSRVAGSSPIVPVAPASRSTSGSIARGAAARLPPRPGNFGNVDLSPDGRWLVYQVGAGTDADLWVRDLKRGVSSRFTFDKGGEVVPLFSRDSRRVVFERREEGKPSRIVERALDRTGEERVLFEATGRTAPLSFSPDGKSLIFQRLLPEKPWQIWIVPIGQPEQAKVVVGSDFINIRRHPLARRTLAALRIERVGHRRGLRRRLCGHVGPVADLDPRRRGSGLGAGRQGAVLSFAREQDDASRRDDRRQPSTPALPRRSSP